MAWKAWMLLGQADGVLLLGMTYCVFKPGFDSMVRIY